MKLDEITIKKDEYYTPEYAIKPILKYIPNTATIWCPFDTPDSNYVKMLLARGNKVIMSHLDSGGDFFTLDDPCDFIVSNPPYSLNTEVFERLFSLNRPFAMLVGVVGIFESQRRFNLFRKNNFEIMYLNKRVAFFDDYSDPKPSLNPPFSSVYLCKGVLPSKIVFEEISK